MSDEYRKNSMSRRRMGGPGGMGGPGVPGEKPKEFIKTWGKLITYCNMYLPFIIIAFVLSIISTVFSIIGPHQISKVTDMIVKGMQTEIQMSAILNIFMVLAVLYGFGAIFGLIQGLIMATITQKISKGLRTSLSKKINKLPLKYFDSTSFGDVLSRVTNDVDMIGQSLNQSIVTLVSAITMFFGSLIMMYYTNGIIATVAILATFIGFGIMMSVIKKSQKYFILQQKDLGAINGHVEEIYSGHNVVRVYNGKKEAKKEFAEMNERLYNNVWKSQFLSGLMMPLMSLVGNLGYVAVCVVGGAMAFNETISFGDIVSFMIYIRLFTQPLSQFAQAATSLQSTAAASERVFEFLEEEELPKEEYCDKVLENAKGDVEFEHVKFGYHEDRIIIHDFSAKVKAGQKIAIVGPTGAGKTTIVNLLMRFYECQSGKIKVDGIPINQLKRENVHNLFCMVLQDTWIFEGTIKENIIYNKVGVTDEEVVNACKAVGLHYFVRSLPKKYDTELDDKATMSAGQKQLLTIARAVVENAPLLILDEATSSVDTRTEVLIQKAMDKLMMGRTSFVIAHRLSTIKNADLILVMKEGDIIESGNHNNLLAKDGFYADLYNSQFEMSS